METRFRNFVRRKRTRSIETNNELSQASVPYQAVPSAVRQPVFLYQPLAKNTRESRKNEGINAIPLRSLSYEDCQPGTAPTMGTVPQKGNGPIKLQGTRRLSSGDQVTTQHHTQDLREGGYVVGRTTRKSSIDQRCLSPTNAIRAQLSPSSQTVTHSNAASPRLTTPIASRTWPSSPVMPSGTQQTLRYSQPTTEHVLVTGFSPSSKSSSRDSHESLVGLKTHSSSVSMSHESVRSANSVSDSNATLKALRKAEFSRLAELYGSDAAAARNIAHMDSARLRGASSPIAYAPPLYSPMVLEPLPPPPAERAETDPRRNSDSSTTDCFYESQSGSSSPQRISYVSSCADSSIMTGQTSLEDESTTTRDEIRGVVEQMRHTYLSAIESQTAPAPKHKSRKKPRRSKMRPPQTINESNIPPNSTLVSRQTWHSSETQQDVTYKRRVNSHPVSRTGSTLSPIPASPNKNEPSGLGLHRADSATLGGLMGEVQRASIKSRKKSTSRASEHINRPRTPPEQIHLPDFDRYAPGASHSDVTNPETTTTPTKTSNGHVKMQMIENTPENTVATTVELDKLFADDLWSSDTQMSCLSGSEFSLQPISSNDSYTAAPSAMSQVTPKKQTPTPRIPSIPESPEYTHLAKIRRPEDNFI